MSSALIYSNAGMQAAADRLSIRARNVANVQTPGFRADGVVQRATLSGPVVSAQPGTSPVDRVAVDTQATRDVPPAPLSGPNQYHLPFTGMPPNGMPGVSLEVELTDMMMAEHAYKASAAVTRTATQMGDALLDILV